MPFQVVPDPADVRLDGGETPVLTFETSHARGSGWVLYCSEYEGYYLGGDLDDQDWAEDAATAKLEMLRDDRDAD